MTDQEFFDRACIAALTGLLSAAENGHLPSVWANASVQIASALLQERNAFNAASTKSDPTAQDVRIEQLEYTVDNLKRIIEQGAGLWINQTQINALYKDEQPNQSNH